MKPKVLMIEDNPQNRYLATYLLEHAGFEVVVAEEGVKGMELADSIKPDLVLLDIQLPDVDGYQIAAALRGRPAMAATPIVAVSSFAMTGDREKALKAGCSGYIEKPIDPETFVQQIKGFLKQGAGG